MCLKKTTPLARRDLVLGAYRVVSSEQVRFLGIWLDRELRWNQQGAAALAKGRDWISRFVRLARPSFGITAKYAGQLYKSIAVPRILYGAEIYLTPPKRQATERQKARGIRVQRTIVGRLASAQRKAMLMVTGGMSTTATDVLEVLTGFLPFHLVVERHRFKAALRLATLPEGHPLFPHVRRAAAVDVRKFRSPVHALMNDFKRDIRGVETVQTTRWDATWRSKLKIEIAGTREEAKRRESADKTRVKIYTDGSGYKGQIGAAAVMMRDGRQVGRLKMNLGSDKECIVYNGECAAIILAMELIRRQTGLAEASIYVDNQAAIIAMGSRKAVPGSYLLDYAHEVYKAARRRNAGIKVTICWVPGHEDVEGNERADTAAKEAAEGRVSAREKLPGILQGDAAIKKSKSALLQAFGGRLKNRAQRGWRLSERYGRMAELGMKKTSKAHQNALAGMSRQHASVITQLITGHAPLNKHLHRIGGVPSPMCSACGIYEETVAHYLAKCTAHRAARERLRARIGPAAMDANRALASTKHYPALLEYVARTRRIAWT
ncbi:hypothetical protein CCMSSC00406_0007901 [Pleurotus cornucopiae]|uniref:Uncharacterized protein n=1 Tax=Pleurotus cornucopiae TaxID=5321 RepID=A0ACB7ISK0_PLECO|nr:hypothetical protein CCMSSC00406_0007901 [Pleurotus cornucopiae]